MNSLRMAHLLVMVALIATVVSWDWAWAVGIWSAVAAGILLDWRLNGQVR